MTCIDDLFDWLLEDIFIKLHRSDRLLCKEVSKRWYKIMMTTAKFREDRHIYLHTNEIKANEPPMSVLMKAQPYQIYTIDNQYAGNDDLFPFFKHVGVAIEDLTLTGNMQKGFFVSMPGLKSLSLKCTSLGHVVLLFTSIKEEYPDFVFKHLEKLQVDYMDFTRNSYVNDVNIIQKLIPKDCRIIFLETTIYRRDEMEKQFCAALDLVAINRINIRAKSRTTETSAKLLEANDLICDELVLECEGGPSPYSLLEALQNKHENLKSINLTYHLLPPIGIELPKLKSLTLQGPISDLKLLEQLMELEYLKLDFKENDCGFDHQAIVLSKLTNLDICMKVFCVECLDTLTNSFENLEDFTFKTEQTLAWSELRTMINNWKSLKTITIETTSIRNWELNSHFEPIDHLRSLNFKKVTNLKIEMIEQISEQFPNLEKISFETENSIPQLPNFIKALVSAFPKLNKFTFILDDKRPIKQLKIICDYLQSIGFPVQDRETKCNDHDSYERLITFTLDRMKKMAKMEKDMDLTGYFRYSYAVVDELNDGPYSTDYVIENWL